MPQHVHSIDVFSSGGGSDGPRRYLPGCMECPWTGTRTENYGAALDEATTHRLNPLEGSLSKAGALTTVSEVEGSPPAACSHVVCTSDRHPDETYCQLSAPMEPHLPAYIVDSQDGIWSSNRPGSHVYYHHRRDGGYHLVTWSGLRSDFIRTRSQFPEGPWRVVSSPAELPSPCTVHE